MISLLFLHLYFTEIHIIKLIFFYNPPIYEKNLHDKVFNFHPLFFSQLFYKIIYKVKFYTFSYYFWQLWDFLFYFHFQFFQILETLFKQIRITANKIDTNSFAHIDMFSNEFWDIRIFHQKHWMSKKEIIFYYNSNIL